MPEQVGESANGEAKRKVANHSFPGRIGQLRQEAAKLEVTTKVEGEKTTVTVAVQSSGAAQSADDASGLG